jgi:diacylglycerol kinase family enzyme
VDAGQLTLRIYAGPLPAFGLEAVRWVARRKPAAPGIRARAVSVRTIDGRPLPVQADGDLMGRRPSWSFEMRPAAVRLIGQW